MKNFINKIIIFFASKPYLVSFIIFIIIEVIAISIVNAEANDDTSQGQQINNIDKKEIVKEIIIVVGIFLVVCFVIGYVTNYFNPDTPDNDIMEGIEALVEQERALMAAQAAQNVVVSDQNILSNIENTVD